MIPYLNEDHTWKRRIEHNRANCFKGKQKMAMAIDPSPYSVRVEDITLTLLPSGFSVFKSLSLFVYDLTEKSTSLLRETGRFTINSPTHGRELGKITKLLKTSRINNE